MAKKIFCSIAIFLLALVLRIYTVPSLHHVYYDEFYYLNIAKNINNFNNFVPTAVGDKHSLELEGEVIRPNGYPLLLSLILKLPGDPEEISFRLNALLGALSVVLIFWIAYLIFENNLNISFWAAVVFNFLPVHLKYSGSGSADISSLFFILLFLFFILLYLKEKRIFLLYLSISAVICSAYIKPENLIFIFPFSVLFVFFRKHKQNQNTIVSVPGQLCEVCSGFRREGDKIAAVRSLNISRMADKVRSLPSGPHLILLVCFLVLSLSSLLSQIPFMLIREQSNAKGAFFSLIHLRKNALVNLYYLFDFRFHSLVGTLFFILGGVVLFFQERKRWLFLFSWFTVFYLIHSSYFYGRFSLLFTSDSDRHLFSLLIPFSLISGYGIYVFLKKIRFRLVSAVLILVLAVINSAFATGQIVNYTLRRDLFGEYLYVKESAKSIPDDLFVVTYAPYVVNALIDKKVADINVFTSLKEYPSMIVLFKGFFWFEYKGKRDFHEKFFLDRYDFKAITEREIGNETYGFYLLTHKS